MHLWHEKRMEATVDCCGKDLNDVSKLTIFPQWSCPILSLHDPKINYDWNPMKPSDAPPHQGSSKYTVDCRRDSDVTMKVEYQIQLPPLKTHIDLQCFWFHHFEGMNINSPASKPSMNCAKVVTKLPQEPIYLSIWSSALRDLISSQAT